MSSLFKATFQRWSVENRKITTLSHVTRFKVGNLRQIRQFETFDLLRSYTELIDSLFPKSWDSLWV